MAFLDETGLAELWSLIQAEDEKLAAVDVKIATGSYTGTGTYGSSNPNSLTLDFEPKLVLIARKGTTIRPFYHHANQQSNLPDTTIWFEGVEKVLVNAYGTKLTFTKSGTTLSWYVESGTSADQQLNGSNATYYYVAIG